MARQRFIDPGFWVDPTIGKLTPVERLFFIGCFSNADDEGRLLGAPAYLRSIIFPYDDISLDEVRTMRDRVVSACRNLVLYEVDGVEYLAFLKWTRYQKPKYPKPSKLPPPPSATNGTGQPPEASRHGPGVAGAGSTVRGCDEESFPEIGECCTQETTGPGLVAGNSSSETEESLLQNGESVTPKQGKPFSETGESLLQNSAMGRDGLGMDLDLGLDLGREGGLGETNQPPEPPPTEPDRPDPNALDPPLSDYERAVLHELKQVKGYPFDITKDFELLRAVMVDFPSIDLLSEVKAWRTYKLDRPIAAKSNPRLQLRNWCRIAAERRTERREVKPGGDQGKRGPTANPIANRRYTEYDRVWVDS